VSVRGAAMFVRRRIDRDGHEAHLAVGDAPLGDNRLREFADLFSFAAKHGDLKAARMVEMDVHRRDLVVVMLVIRIGQPLRQLASVVVEDIGERRDAIAGKALIDAGALEAEAGEIAHRF